ncbi:MAG: ABC transporter permease [Acidimicrobiia bacterium]|nr:ABC transporter permease [Acidimicrobiia bacterium]
MAVAGGTRERSGPAVPHPLSARVAELVPSSGWAPLRLDQVWAFRDLLGYLALRDIKVRYKQTVLGAAWAILQPLLLTAVFTVVFGRLADVPSDGVPYLAFALAGMVMWTFFSAGLTAGSLSLVNNAAMVSKVWFPRLCVPIAAVLATLVDLAAALGALAVVVLGLGLVPGPGVVVLPGLVLLAAAACLGTSLWLSAVNVLYRDVRHMTPFLVQLWLFATPVVYPSSLIEGVWRYVFALNPMVGVVEGTRWALFGSGTQVGPLVLVSSTSALAVLLGGAYVFRRLERTFADVI